LVNELLGFAREFDGSRGAPKPLIGFRYIVPSQAHDPANQVSISGFCILHFHKCADNRTPLLCLRENKTTDPRSCGMIQSRVGARADRIGAGPIVFGSEKTEKATLVG